jgi:lipopolysaccharide/colanic/teichoic acid biosynthesis glycosyltransferase
LLLVVAALVKLTSPGPVFFRQRRLGQFGQPFDLVKFRSMVDRPQDQGPQITASGDARITSLGRLLRRSKLDELPQLWNVIRGDMALVGPRPEVPRYVQHYPQLFGLVLQQRPGITDICTLQLRNEEQILAQAEDPERYYVERLLPRKLAASIREGWRRNFWRDLRIILATVVPTWQNLAPLPDFRPLASLYTLPESPRQAMVSVAGATAVEPTWQDAPRRLKVEAGA